MAHAMFEKQKLLNRVRRLRGQVDAIGRALIADHRCGDVMRLVTATRGSISGILAEVVNGQTRAHLVGSKRMSPNAKRDTAVELVGVLHTYIR